MNANSYLPNKDDELDHWLTNFNTVAATNQTGLPLTILEINTSENATDDFSAALNNVVTTRAAAKMATMNKDDKRKIAVATVRAMVKKIQADPNVADALKLELGITIPVSRPKPLPVFAPANAVASIQAGGVVQLVWDANGNAPGAVYTIEMSLGTADNWNVVNAQTATRYLDTEAPLGTVMYYRIKAQRNTRVSAYSNNAMVTAH